MTNANDTTYTKEIRFIARNDYAAVVNGEEIGYASTRLGAQRIADDYVLGQIAHEAQCQAVEAQAAPVAVEAASVARPRIATAAGIAATLEQARTRLSEDRRWLRALDKAAANLAALRWQFDATGRRLMIASATTANRRYIVEHAQPGHISCSCTAGANGRVCWHAAAYGLLTRAAFRHQTAAA